MQEGVGGVGGDEIISWLCHGVVFVLSCAILCLNYTNTDRYYTSIKCPHSCGNPEATLYLLVTTFDDLHVNLDSLLLLKLGRLGLLLLTPGKVMKLETSFPASYAFLLLLLFYGYTWLRTPLNQHLTPLIQQESPSNNFRLGVKMLVGWRCT